MKVTPITQRAKARPQMAAPSQEVTIDAAGKKPLKLSHDDDCGCGDCSDCK